MKDGIGEGKSRTDHPHVASQLYAAYARVQDVRSLASVIGEDELPLLDRQYLAFGKNFERVFLKQREDENRTIETSLDMAWDLLSILPRTELIRLSEEELDTWYKAKNDNT